MFRIGQTPDNGLEDQWPLGSGDDRPAGAARAPHDVEKALLQGFRRMSPERKLHRVSQLNRLVRDLAAAGIRARYGADIPERELNLRLAALRLGRPTMIAAFQWDPDQHR